MAEPEVGTILNPTPEVTETPEDPTVEVGTPLEEPEALPEEVSLIDSIDREQAVFSSDTELEEEEKELDLILNSLGVYDDMMEMDLEEEEEQTEGYDDTIADTVIREMQRNVGTKEDGIWGKNSKAALQEYLKGFGVPDEVVQNVNVPTMLARPSEEPVEEATGIQADIEKEVTETLEGTGTEGSDEFDTALKSVENSIRSGYDEKTELWKPHSSLEGGTDTLGYGHKITPEEEKSGTISINGEDVNYKDGLTEEQIDALYLQDKEKHAEGVSALWDNWETMDEKYKNVLINIAFNVGIDGASPTKWPSLKKAIEKGDEATIRKEMITSYKDAEGNRQQLTTRAKQIADALGLQEE